MLPFQEIGIAAANIISAIIQVILLYTSLRKKYPEYRVGWRFCGVFSMFWAAICMVFCLSQYESSFCPFLNTVRENVVRLAVEIPFGAAIYFSSYFLIRFILRKTKGDRFII